MGPDHPAVRRISHRTSDLGEVEAFWRDHLRANVVFDEARAASGAFHFDAAMTGDLSTGVLRPHAGFTVHDGPSESYIAHPVTGAIELSPRFRLPTGPWSRLLRLYNELMVDPDNPMSQPAILVPLGEALLTALLLGADHQHREALIRPAEPCLPRSVRHAVDAIHACPELPYTVAGLAQLCGVSTRALQHGFRTRLGTSPMAYLRDVRLAHARDELISGATRGVAEVAHRWGFTHLGRFAAAYAEQYGEAPSQSRRRRMPGH